MHSLNVTDCLYTEMTAMRAARHACSRKKVSVHRLLHVPRLVSVCIDLRGHFDRSRNSGELTFHYPRKKRLKIKRNMLRDSRLQAAMTVIKSRDEWTRERRRGGRREPGMGSYCLQETRHVALILHAWPFLCSSFLLSLSPEHLLTSRLSLSFPLFPGRDPKFLTISPLLNLINLQLSTVIVYFLRSSSSSSSSYYLYFTPYY